MYACTKSYQLVHYIYAPYILAESIDIGMRAPQGGDLLHSTTATKLTLISIYGTHAANKNNECITNKLQVGECTAL